MTKLPKINYPDVALCPDCGVKLVLNSELFYLECPVCEYLIMGEEFEERTGLRLW
jgi:hypothetical protein